MRVLVVHNFYRSENASGENLSVLDEIDALRELGWDVEVVSADSDVIGRQRAALVRVGGRPVYSRRSVRRVSEATERFRPHVALVENLFPLHSPWIIRTLRSAGVPVAAGVRSYRMWCAASTMFRDGAPCEDCLGSACNLPAVRHGCYQGRATRSAPMAISLTVHRSTWHLVDCFLPVSDYVAGRLGEFGIPAHRIVVRPNFVTDPGEALTTRGSGHGFVFAGRLTVDKGVDVMLDAWRRSGLGGRGETLRVAGSGPLESLVASAGDSVEPLGLVPHERLLDVVRDTAVMVVPSRWPEPFGRGVIEAVSLGRPSLVTRAGGLADLVVDGVTGWVAEPDVDSLAEGFLRAARDPAAREAAGRAARDRYSTLYTREVSVGILEQTLSRLARAPRG